MRAVPFDKDTNHNHTDGSLYCLSDVKRRGPALSCCPQDGTSVGRKGERRDGKGVSRP